MNAFEQAKQDFILDRSNVYVLNYDPVGGPSESAFYGCASCRGLYSIVYPVENAGDVCCPKCEPLGWTVVSASHVNTPRIEA